ncbi:MAG: APC family permease, partial [Anaerolineales bacterium]|nr:APC family permease [Anaerolineales bacterium]MDW8448061.1 APC family permease [Anaerolineales bacterium]
MDGQGGDMDEQGEKAARIQQERKKLKRELTVLPLFGLLYFTVCGGAFGTEGIIGYSGPGMALILLAVTPILFSIPSMLMVRELSSMMPVEGGFYHWVKQAFGPFAGFLVAWMNLLTSWLDVSIYPVLAAYYLGFFIPALRNGTSIGGIFLSGKLLSWLVALALIWSIVLLQIRGARLSGLTADWLGLVMMIPLLIMSILGFSNWIRQGGEISLPLLPEGETIWGAFSVGLFIAMWNYMGWELPSSAGGEIVHPRRTYPLAMALTLLATVLTYSLPVTAGLFGGAGENGKYQLWGIEENQPGEGIAAVLADYGITAEQLEAWGVDGSRSIGWQYPDVAQEIGKKFSPTHSQLGQWLGMLVTLSAVLSMTGLFIGNSLGASRLPYALAEDGMMPLWMVKTHPRYGTPWVAILVAGVLFSLFSLGTFAFLVVVDVFMDTMALLLQFLALWKLRFSHPNVPRARIPGGWLGLTLVTLGPVS